MQGAIEAGRKWTHLFRKSGRSIVLNPSTTLHTTKQPTPMRAQVRNIYQTNPAVFIKNLTQHFTFEHCQPKRNYDTEQLQEGNGKIDLEKVPGQSSSIQPTH